MPPMPPHEATESTNDGSLRQRITAADNSPSSGSHEESRGPTVEPNKQQQTSQVQWSSGVPFYPPSTKYWRIGNKWYDFTDFVDKHPGGAQAVLMARDRFEDATFVFEAHHHEYQKTRAIIKKYEVPESVALAHGITHRPGPGSSELSSAGAHSDKFLDAATHPDLLTNDAFYSVIRRKVARHLKEINCRAGGPTTQCIVLFWLVFAAYCSGMYATWTSGSFLVSAMTAIFGALLGAFGHNWVHQPKYKNWGWAILSLDVLGFSSESWYREHNLQHHMYTNTPWDNHFIGTEPFLVTNPTVKRAWFQKYVMPYINPIVLCFGVYGNYFAHLVELLKGNEELSIGKLLLPLHFYFMISKWGLVHGFLLTLLFHAIIGLYYFTLALMNHNAEHTHDVQGRNATKDWGHAQLHSSADWGVNMSFLQAGIYLWLNYHTVHHLFPRLDFSHHPAIQSMLIETCKEHGIKYTTGTFIGIYREMLTSFSTPRSLYQTITVYGGGI
jgi:fatty acid desaturase